MQYPGGKNGGGLFQRIICQIPPHRVYVEPFAGSAAVLRMKRPAEVNLAIDLDPGAVGNLAGVVPEATMVFEGDGIDWLEELARRSATFVGGNGRFPAGINDLAEYVIYCDPPYLNTRTPQRYAYRMGPAEHERLLGVLRRLRCQVLVSGYHCTLYHRLLKGWRVVEFPAYTRGGPSTEVLWCNFPEPRELHDYRFLGRDHRKRLDIRRQQKRWARKLQRMDRLQRLALMEVLQTIEPGGDGESAAAVPDGTTAAGSAKKRRQEKRRCPVQ